MYNNTIPLLKANFGSIDKLSLVNTNPRNDFFTVAEYNKADKDFSVRNDSPDWFRNDLKGFIEGWIDQTSGGVDKD